jgi:hypothetical protein
MVSMAKRRRGWVPACRSCGGTRSSGLRIGAEAEDGPGRATALLRIQRGDTGVCVYAGGSVQVQAFQAVEVVGGGHVGRDLPARQ